MVWRNTRKDIRKLNVPYFTSCCLGTTSLKDKWSSQTSVPGDSDDKKSTCNAGDLGSIPGSGRSPGEGNGNPLLYSCLENPMIRGAGRATVHGVAKSRTQLSD